MIYYDLYLAYIHNPHVLIFFQEADFIIILICEILPEKAS